MEWNIADIFEGIADARPDLDALVSDGRHFTYRELDERATRLANGLRARGVGPGDHIGVYLYNSNAYMETVLAAHKLRAVPINVNYRYVEGELHYLFDNADLVAVVHHRVFTPRIAAVRASVPRITTYVAVDDGSDEDIETIGAFDYESFLAAASPERDFGPRSPDDLYIVYTGGTTGMPKGVMWRSEDFIKSTILPLISLGRPVATSPEAVVEEARTGNPVVIYTVAPLMHGAAFWVGLMALLSCRELVVTSAPHFDPEAVWDTVEQERANTILIVGDAMARPLLDVLEANPDRWDTSSLFILGSGGAILSPGLKQRINELLPNVIITDSHGASETGVQGTVAGTDEQGRPRFAMGADTAVLGTDNRPLPAGSPTPGRLARRGHVPLGYYKDPEKSASTFIEIDGERWALPGDMALHEADGTITLLGRGSVSINTGGEKVYPEEVELALKSHPGVFDAVVIGVPDERFGERVAAVVAPVPGAEVTLDDLVSHARAELASYKLPRELHLVERIERSPAGKADYRWAKAIATAET